MYNQYQLKVVVLEVRLKMDRMKDENNNLTQTHQTELIKKEQTREEDKVKKVNQEEENKNYSLWQKIKSAWNWFYSGRIKAFIWRVLELWAKWTFLYNMTDLLMLSTILFAVPFFAQIATIYASVKMLIFACFVGVSIFNVVRESRDTKEAQSYIDEVNQEYCTGLDGIYKDSLISKVGAKFVWQNFRGRLFDILVTSSCLLFIPSHITFVLYCVFVAISALCFLKDVGIAIYWYLDIRNKHRNEKMVNLQENSLDKNPSRSITQIMTETQNLPDTNREKKYSETEHHETLKMAERATSNDIDGNLEKSSGNNANQEEHNKVNKTVSLPESQKKLDKNPNQPITQIMPEKQSLLDTNGEKKYSKTVKMIKPPALNDTNNLEKSSVNNASREEHNKVNKPISLSELRKMNESIEQQMSNGRKLSQEISLSELNKMNGRPNTEIVSVSK